MRFRDTRMGEGVVVTCHAASVTVPRVSVAPSGPLSLCLAANSWLPEPLPCNHGWMHVVCWYEALVTGYVFALLLLHVLSHCIIHVYVFSRFSC